MSPLPLKPFHLKHLPIAKAADISTLFKMRLQDDVHQQIAYEICSGKPLNIAIRHARAQVKRDNQSCAFVSLDNFKEDAPNLYDMIAATDPSDFLDELCASRMKMFDNQTESVLQVLRNPASNIGKSITGMAICTLRRKQQIVAKNIGAQESAKRFEDGCEGQGELFGFDCSVDDGEVENE